MSITKIVFGDFTSLKVGGSEVEGATSAQYSLPAENRPIYTFGSPKPRCIVTSPSLGSGSFSYICSDGGLSSMETAYETSLNGASDVTINGGYYEDGLPAPVVTLKNAVFQNKSFGMNAKGEGTMSVSFSFKKLG